ncbi:MAG: hypothetical protein ACRD6Q_04665 [Nitrososphaeraceae archaeon]
MGKKKKIYIQKPDPMRKKLVIPDVDSGAIYLLNKWLETKSEETGTAVSDIFAEAVLYDLIRKDWDREKVREIYAEYQEQQRKLSKTYIEYCDHTMK